VIKPTENQKGNVTYEIVTKIKTASQQQNESASSPLARSVRAALWVAASELGSERVSHEWERVSQILNGGAMPLDLLQERVQAWTKAQAAQNRQATN
jgi:hypothetical protein